MVEPGWSLEVDPESDGDRLDRFIARRLARVSRNRAARLEVIDLDAPTASAPLKKSARVRCGQRLWVSRPPPDEDLSVLSPPTLIAECDRFLIIDKPSGWAVHPTASRFQATITTWMTREGLKGAPTHRLDVETSGVLLCTKRRVDEAMVKAAFREHRVKKYYRAICEGAPPVAVGQSWVNHTPLGFDLESAVRIKMGRGALEARTHFTLLALDQSASTPLRSLILAEPLSGRQHQIRAHLSMSGLPIVGDKLYGHSETYFLAHLEGALSSTQLGELGHYRHALHAYKISLLLENVRYEWSAPWPLDLNTLYHIERSISDD